MPNYNGQDFLPACLGSLLRLDYPDYRVMVVDNASTDGSVALIKKEFPQVEIIQNRRNTGFAGGCNSGLKRALEGTARYFVLVNNDTTADPDWLRELVAAADSDPRIGLCQSMIYLDGEPERINSAGNEAHYLGFGYCGHYLEVDRGQFPEVADVPFASGTALLLRRETLEEIGLLDEDFFMYQEDMDLGWRARLAGWRVVLASRSRIHHSYSFSRNPEKFYYLERNRLVMSLKNYSGRSLLVMAPAFLGAETAMLAYSVAGGWFRQKLRGYLYLIRNFDAINRKRRQVQLLRQTGDSEATAFWTSRMGFADLRESRLTKIANPVSAAYWKLARKLI
ncbi:MAG: glycosyltransferase family 2 protein [Thermoleophilia bacterium]|nr:glycosyltransferase family 2 protein [Thermoleophilia bacterium]